MPEPTTLPRRVRALLPAAALLLSACESKLAVELSVSLPQEIESAHLAVTTIELLDSEGGVTSIDVDDSETFDLAAYPPDSPRRLLDAGGELSGEFVGLRLRYDDSDAYVLSTDGGSAPIALLAAGDYADIDLQLDEGGSALLSVHLDLPFSLTDQRSSLGNYQMIPVSRAVDADTAASIDGLIDSDAISDEDCRDGRSAGDGVAVYLYAGTDITPADYYNNGAVITSAQPIGYAAVNRDSSSGEWRYTLAPLTPGDYTVAWTCAADADNPGLDDDLAFVASQNISVEGLETGTLDF